VSKHEKHIAFFSFIILMLAMYLFYHALFYCLYIRCV